MSRTITPSALPRRTSASASVRPGRSSAGNVPDTAASVIHFTIRAPSRFAAVEIAVRWASSP
jgi:hypothetical protein